MIDCLGAVNISEDSDVLDELMGLDKPRPAHIYESEKEEEEESRDENEYDEYVHTLQMTIEKLHDLIDFFREEMI